jgi:Zn-dependent protease
MAGPTLRGGLPLFSFRGIKVLVHWSFLLLPAWIIISGLSDGVPFQQLLAHVGLVLVVFICVVVHEFGHALTAQHYGIRTRDITLLPIGGVASLERMPEDPKQEFWITIAGPLMNLIIAALAFLVIAITGVSLFFSDLLLGATTWTSVLSFVLMANLSLFLFNLVPAFPMDGGRILRSLLSMRLPTRHRYCGTRWTPVRRRLCDRRDLLGATVHGPHWRVRVLCRRFRSTQRAPEGPIGRHHCWPGDADPLLVAPRHGHCPTGGG